MKSFFLTNFQDIIQFIPARGIHGNLIIVHSVEVNPADDAMASIIGAGIKDEEITLAKNHKPYVKVPRTFQKLSFIRKKIS